MSRLFLGLAALLLFASAPLAQGTDALRVAYDCQTGGCDREFFQTELPYVQFVRDQGNADVFVLITGDRTGGGGRRYTLLFQGRGDFEGQEATLTTTVGNDATDDDERRALVSRLGLGFASYVAQTPLADRLSIAYTAPEVTTETAEPQVDPWNGWTFRLRGSSFFNGSSNSTSFNGNGGLSGSRVTDGWKTRLGVFGNYSRSTFDSETGSVDGTDTTFVSQRSNYGGDGLVARSLGPHLTVGAQFVASSNTFSNYDARVVAGPAIEYSLFPYDESTRRLVTANYGLALEFAAYADSTVFGEIQEVLPQHSARIRTEFAQPWGSVDVSLTAQQYLSQLDKYEAGLGGNLNIRLARGLQFRIGGSASVIENQLSLSAIGLTQEEILTEQRQRGTSFRYFGNIGLTYSFGSIFSGAVNPRFSRGGGLVIVG